MKKWIAMMLAMLMILPVFPALAAGPVEVTLLLEGNTVSPDASDRVLAVLNPYLEEKIGVRIRPVWGTWSNFNELAVNAINAGSDEYDIIFTCSWTANEYSSFSRKGAYVRLDDPADNLLEEYGQDLLTALPEILWEGARVNGIDGEGIYAVPGFKDFAQMNTWDLNVTLLNKYGYSVEDVKNEGFYGWGDMFAKVKAGEEAETGETFYPFTFEAAVAERNVNLTPAIAGDGNSVLSYYMNTEDVSQPGPRGLEIFCKYLTPEFEKYAKQMREYYLAGYINPGIAIGETATDTWRNAQNTGRYLISTEVSLYGYETTTSAARGIEVAYLMSTESPYIDNTSVQGAMMAVSANSAHPEEAVKFLNILNTDPYVMTLLNYGIEGEHYTLNDAGEVVFNAAARESYFPWKNGLGNITLLPPEQGQGADFQERFAAFYAESKRLPIYGFTFDKSEMATEFSAIVNVKDAYARSLFTGAVDPEKAIPELRQKLEAAGIDRIVEEANRQLNEFLAQQN